MVVTQTLFIIVGILSFFLLFALCVLFFVSRKSQKTMEALLKFLTSPEKAKVHDAVRVLQEILTEEMEKIESNFNNISTSLQSQINVANELKMALDVQKESLITTSDDATKKMLIMSQRLDNTLSDLRGVVGSSGWQDVEIATDKFSSTINELLERINLVSEGVTEKVDIIEGKMTSWVSSSKNLTECIKESFDKNEEQMTSLNAEYLNMQQRVTDLAKTTAEGFENVKVSANDYEKLMEENDKLLDTHLDKMDSFSKQSKKQLTTQMNTLTNTANVIGGQVRLTESSIEKQIRKLTDVVENLMSTATTTENSIKNISMELANLTNRFNNEIKEFATGVVTELKTVSGVANTTLENTKNAAGAFSDSVKAMATGVRETLIEMNTAHTQLSGQSENLIKMSAETTAQLQPLSELIEKYYSALPDLAKSSVETGSDLEKIVANLNEKIALMKTTVTESTSTISDSAIKLEDLADKSRQQMIDLMSDYAKAVNTMQTLNKQMMVARAAAPMDAINTVPNAAAFGKISSQDFLKQSEKIFDKMHEQSLDLTQAIGAEIPDVVWKKYHAGDKTIFSKWLAKVVSAADKKQLRDVIKTDSVFRSQATQFIRSFDKLLNVAKQSDNADKLASTILKTELGQIYTALKSNI